MELAHPAFPEFAGKVALQLAQQRQTVEQMTLARFGKTNELCPAVRGIGLSDARAELLQIVHQLPDGLLADPDAARELAEPRSIQVDVG